MQIAAVQTDSSWQKREKANWANSGKWKISRINYWAVCRCCCCRCETQSNPSPSDKLSLSNESPKYFKVTLCSVVVVVAVLVITSSRSSWPKKGKINRLTRTRKTVDTSLSLPLPFESVLFCRSCLRAMNISVDKEREPSQAERIMNPVSNQEDGWRQQHNKVQHNTHNMQIGRKINGKRRGESRSADCAEENEIIRERRARGNQLSRWTAAAAVMTVQIGKDNENTRKWCWRLLDGGGIVHREKYCRNSRPHFQTELQQECNGREGKETNLVLVVIEAVAAAASPGVVRLRKCVCVCV